MRCYDGAPDSDLQRYLDEMEDLRSRVRKFEPEAHCTYHAPHGDSHGGYVVHVWGRELSGYHQVSAQAWNEALRRVQS